MGETARRVPGPKGPKEPKGAAEETAGRILAAAVSVFSRYGFRRASVDDVAREAGVAKGTIYLYHESKEALFTAVAQRVADQLLEAASAARRAEVPFPERLRLVLEAKFLTLFDVVTRSPHAAELLDSKSRLAADVFEAADRKYHAHVAAVLAEAADAGLLDLPGAGLSPATAATYLVRVGHGLATPDAHGALPSRDAYRRRIAELVRVSLRGLGRAGGGTIPA